jgi:uncharacterized protein
VSEFLDYPYAIDVRGRSATTAEDDHVRDLIMQVLFTSPGERVFRPEFGFGARAMVFEPNRAPLWEVARNRLYAALA